MPTALAMDMPCEDCFMWQSNLPRQVSGVSARLREIHVGTFELKD